MHVQFSSITQAPRVPFLVGVLHYLCTLPENQGAWQTHVCHVAVCMGYPIAGEVPRASVEAPWIPASLVPGSNPAARAARSGSSGSSGKGKQRVGWQPPIGRGRWRGALLQAPGHIFLIDECKRGEL